MKSKLKEVSIFFKLFNSFWHIFIRRNEFFQDKQRGSIRKKRRVNKDYIVFEKIPQRSSKDKDRSEKENNTVPHTQRDWAPDLEDLKQPRGNMPSGSGGGWQGVK